MDGVGLERVITAVHPREPVRTVLVGSVHTGVPLSVFWERGSPDLPARGPRRGCASRPVRPIFINKAFKTLARGQASRGAKPREADDARPPQERPRQAGS